MNLTFISITAIAVSIFCLIGCLIGCLFEHCCSKQIKANQAKRRLKNKQKLNRQNTFAECLLPID